MIPFLGVFFTLPLHDLFILFISLSVVHQFKLRAPFKFFALVITWVVLSLGIELTRVDLYVSGVRGVTSPYSEVKSKLVSDGKTLALHGDVNTTLYAAGQRSFVSVVINVAGMRSITGLSMFNRAGNVDIPDAVFERGWTPRIGGSSYPRLTINREQRNGIEFLSVVAQQTENGSISRFERAYPIPDPHPGAENALRDIVMPIFNDNFIRYFFQLNREIRLYSELDDFLTSILGPNASDGEKLLFTDFSTAVVSEVELQTDEIKQGVEATINQQNSLWHNSEIEGFSKRCPFTPVGREFGSDESGRTYVSLAETKPPRPVPMLLGRIDPDYGAFSYFCDKTKADLIAFQRYGKHLKISKYDRVGKLQSTAYFRKPMRFEHPAQIVESSVVRSGNDVLSFAVVMPRVLVYSPQQIIAKDRFQRIDFTIPQFSDKPK